MTTIQVIPMQMQSNQITIFPACGLGHSCPQAAITSLAPPTAAALAR